MTTAEEGHAFHLTNVLILLGIIVTTVGLIYFATAFMDRVSEWGKLAALVSFTVAYVALGRAFEAGAGGGSLVTARGLRWLRVPSALYVLGGVAAFVTAVFFVSMDEVPEFVKVLVTVLLGLALMGAAAWWRERRHPSR